MSLIHAVSLLMLPASSSTDVENIMRQIEAQVVLPARAGPLDAYGRNYALSGDDEVIGVYVVPPTQYKKNMNCSYGKNPCSAEIVNGMIKRQDEYIASQAALGAHRWFDSVKKLPLIMDGGCSVITLHYKLSTKRVISIGCNGVA